MATVPDKSGVNTIVDPPIEYTTPDIIILEQAEYDALNPPRTDVLYFVLEPA